MRVYEDSSQESLRARKLLAQWTDDGLLSKEQYHSLEQDTISDLRTTNIFLRLVLLLFTIIGVVAAVALFFELTAVPSSGSTAGICFLVFAVLCYVAAEIAAAQAQLFRYGIEEALAVCSVVLICIGLGSILSGSGAHYDHDVMFLISAAGAGSSLWVWHRFGLWYVFPAAMVFTAFLPTCCTPSHSAQRCFICFLYGAGLICIAAIRSRHRFDYLEKGYSLAEAFLWMGIYLALNLKLSAIRAPSELWGNTRSTVAFAASFYWTTWVLLWCLPPLILLRGVRQKDRFVIAAGMITAILTLLTNKPYLGWQRQTWDPMLLGITLIAAALLLLRWLARGPDGVQHGFTAASVTGRQKHALSVASSVLGLLSPQSVTPAPQPRGPGFESGFGGGSGGAGASGDF